MLTRRTLAGALIAGVAVLGATAVEAADPLPSWNDGPARRSVVAFVENVTRAGGPGYAPPAERIAVFDNDGCLWSEQPMYFQASRSSSSIGSRRSPRSIRSGRTRSPSGYGRANLDRLGTTGHTNQYFTRVQWVY